MLDDPAQSYDRIGRRFGITRQRVGEIAAQLGIDGKDRQRDRTAEAFLSNRTKRRYSPAMKAVVRELRRLNMTVEPYRPVRSTGSLGLVVKKTLLIDGVPCHVHCRRGAYKTAARGPAYVLFHVSRSTKAAKAAVLAHWMHGKLKLYVVPTRHLRNVRTIRLPGSGKYSEHNNNKPKRDWRVYEGAWHLLGRE